MILFFARELRATFKHARDSFGIHPIRRTPIGSAQAKGLHFSFFSQRHARRYAYPDLSIAKRLLLANTIITADGHFAFVNNYKAGCSAVAHLLYLYDHGRTAETSVHGGLMKGVMAFPTQAVSFSTVRHPEHRAISCYFNFFVTNANPVAQRHTEKVARFGFYSKEDLHYSFDVFLEYVRANFEISGLRCDGHFRAQNLNPGYRLVTLSDIAKLETPDAHCQTWVL